MKPTFITKEQIKKIVETYPTPFHIYDEKGLRDNARSINEAFDWNPGFKEYFAVKANNNPFLLKILKDQGFGADCSSMAELMLANELGFKGEEIMFSSNETPEEEFAYAADLGAIINLDDFTHIKYLENIIGQLPETMCCRYNPGGAFAVSGDIMGKPEEAKYGMTKEQLFEAYRIMKEKGVRRFGIHAFLCSNTLTDEYYPALARTLFELCVEIKEKLDISLDFVNLSGGVGIAYRPEERANDIKVISQGVQKAYEEVLAPAGLGDVKIFTEMGRYVMGPYGCLVTKVIHQKHTYKEYIGVDACAANLMRPAIYGAYHHITVAGKETAEEKHKYDIVGSLCENSDKFAINRMLPEIQIGDYLMIHDTGAHGFSMGYNYNGRLHSSELLLKENGDVQLIRRAQTIKDYFVTFDCFDIIEGLLR